MSKRKRKDPDYDLWITDDDAWDGWWMNFECRCRNGHTWREVMPEYAEPDICPKRGTFLIDVGPGMYKVETTLPRH